MEHPHTLHELQGGGFSSEDRKGGAMEEKQARRPRRERLLTPGIRAKMPSMSSKRKGGMLFSGVLSADRPSSSSPDVSSASAETQQRR